MNRVVVISLVFVGLLHAIPTIGALGVEPLATLYGITFDDQRVILLMRHRAVLFGILAALFLLSIAQPALRSVAIGAGLISSGSFCVLALTMELNLRGSESLYRVFQLDIAASLMLLLAAVLHAVSELKKRRQQVSVIPRAEKTV